MKPNKTEIIHESEALRECIGRSGTDMRADGGDITLTFVGGNKVTFWTSEWGGMMPAVLTEAQSWLTHS